MNEQILMKCGCVSQGVLTAIGGKELDKPIPSCVVHDCYEPADARPDLAGRMAQCAYRPHGHAPRPSSFDLAFFEYLGAGSREATELCKCGYARVAHFPRWQATIHVVRRWYKIERHEDNITKEGHAADESSAKVWAEREADFFRSQTSGEAKVFSADVTGVRQIKSPMKCTTFTPKGAQEFDRYYCGCHGWD